MTTPRQERGRRRRTAIVGAAAELALEAGLAAVSHRAVARRAGVPLGSTTYYFATLDELLGEATRVVIEQVVAQGRKAAVTVGPVDDPATAAAAITTALLPDSDRARVLAYYELLLGTARYEAVAAVVRSVRPTIDALIADLLDRLGWSDRVDSALVLAVVDGAVVSALSEGHDVRGHAERLLTDLLGTRLP